MRKHRWRIAADVPLSTKTAILKAHRPRFAKVFLLSVTWAYGVDDDFAFDDAMQRWILRGLYTDQQSQAFLVTNATSDCSERPDTGRPLFLTLSTGADVQPVAAGQFRPEWAKPLEREIAFDSRLVRHPLWMSQPTAMAG